MKLLLILLSQFIIQMAVAQENIVKSKILYVYDPLCGWCYGFTPVMQTLSTKYKEKFDFEVISGGMVVGQNEGSISNIAPYISQAYKNVEKTTGIKFGEPFLSKLLWDSSYRMSSVKPSVALTVFKFFKPEFSFDFAHELQAAFYLDGQSLEEDSTYLKLISKYNIDANEYKKLLNSAEFKSKAFSEFKNSSNLGVKGFPTVLYIKNNQAKLLTSGYQNVSSLEQILNKLP